MTITLLLYNVKSSLFFFDRPLWSTQLTDFSSTDITVSYRDALDRLRVHLNIILLVERNLLTGNAHQKSGHPGTKLRRRTREVKELT